MDTIMKETHKELVQSVWEMEDDWIDFKEIAQCLDVSQRTVHRLFWEGNFGKGLLLKSHGKEAIRVRRSRVNDYLMRRVVDPDMADNRMEQLPNADLLFLHSHLDQLEEPTASWCREEVDRRIRSGLIPEWCLRSRPPDPAKQAPEYTPAESAPRHPNNGSTDPKTP